MIVTFTGPMWWRRFKAACALSYLIFRLTFQGKSFDINIHPKG